MPAAWRWLLSDDQPQSNAHMLRMDFERLSEWYAQMPSPVTCQVAPLGDDARAADALHVWRRCGTFAGNQQHGTRFPTRLAHLRDGAEAENVPIMHALHVAQAVRHVLERIRHHLVQTCHRGPGVCLVLQVRAESNEHWRRILNHARSGKCCSSSAAISSWRASATPEVAS
mgnify:CR=1 FL=1